MGLGNYTKCLFVEDLVETGAPQLRFLLRHYRSLNSHGHPCWYNEQDLLL